MSRSHSSRLIAILIALVLIAASCSNRDKSKTSSGSSNTSGGTAAQTGIDTSNCPTDPSEKVSGDTIKLVSSFPQSGLTAPFAEIARGWKAFFQYTNANGGVTIAGKKYKIQTADKDDEYNAEKTSQNIEEEVGTDGSKAFAVFGVVGTANNINIRDSLNANCVPNLLAATGSPAMGDPKFPWTIGGPNVPYTLEGKAFEAYLAKNKPNATVAMLVQNDDFGAAYEQGFKKAIEGTNIKVVKVEKYPAGANEVGAQMTSLAATNADAFFDGATLLACPDALKKAQAANWKPIIWASGTCISKTLMGIAGDAAQGIISASNLMDPVSPVYANTAAMKLYKQTVKKYQPEADTDNGIVDYGWTAGSILVKALEGSKGADRLDVMNSVRHLNAVTTGLLLDGISMTTNGDKDPYMAETIALVKYDATKKYFTTIGPLENYEGQTAKYTPKALIVG